MNIRKLAFPILSILIIVAASAISLYTLNDQSIRLDESQSLVMYTPPVWRILQISSQDVNAPLYGIILHFWMQFFGTNIIMVRLLSFLFFIITLPFLYFIAKDASNSRVAMVTIMLFSLSPFIMWYSNETRTYSFFILLTCLSHIFFLKLYRSQGKQGKLGYYLTSVAGILTHYFFFFILISQAVFLFWNVIRHFLTEGTIDKNFSQKILKSITPRVIAYVNIITLSLLTCLPWFLYVLQSGFASTTQPMIEKPTSYNIFQAFVNFIFGFQNQLVQTLLVSMWPLLILILFFVFTRKKGVTIAYAEYYVLTTFLPIILAFFISYFRPIFLTRYLSVVTPTLFLLISWLILNYSKRISQYLLSGIVIILFILLIQQNISANTPVKEDYRSVDNYLEESATAKDIIAVSSPFTVYPIEYSYVGDTKIDTIPLWDRYQTGAIPAFNEKDLIQQVNKYKKIYSNIYLVLSYDQGYENKIIYYFDTHFALLGVKHFSPGLQVRVYKLRYDVVPTLSSPK